MAQLARPRARCCKLRDNWVIVDPAHRPQGQEAAGPRTVKPVQALAAALTGVAEIDDIAERGRSSARCAAEGARAARHAPRRASRWRCRPRCGPSCATTRSTASRWLDRADLASASARCLADDMGLGKTVTLIALHLHRAGRRGPTLVVCPASLLGNWEAEIRRFAPGVAVRRHHGAGRDLDGSRTASCSRPTAPCATTPPPLDRARLGPGGRRRGAAHQEPPLVDRAGAAGHPAAARRVALTGTPVENNLSELWAILDWATPGLLGSRDAFRKVWARAHRGRRRPREGRQFADLIGPFLLRRRKSDPGIAPELPPKTETDHLGHRPEVRRPRSREGPRGHQGPARQAGREGEADSGAG